LSKIIEIAVNSIQDNPLVKKKDQTLRRKEEETEEKGWLKGCPYAPPQNDDTAEPTWSVFVMRWF